MRQPYRHLCGVRRNENFAPKNLKIHASADLWSKISPDNRVRIEPDIIFKRPLPQGSVFSTIIAADELKHFAAQLWNPQGDQIVLFLQIRNIKLAINR